VNARLPRATTVNDRDGNRLYDDLDLAFATADPGARLPVVVSFTAGTATADGLRDVLATAPGVAVRRAFTIIPAFAGDLTLLEARRIAALPRVRQLELDADGTPELDTATAVMGAAAVVDVLGIDGSMDGSPAASTTDIGIAVLDSGIHTPHVDLAGRVIAWRDFGTGRSEPYDPNGHGTHVASIAAGGGIADPAMRGVAPGAALIGVKIDGGGNTTSNTIAAYEWLVAERERLNVRVATISFGFGTATDGTTALERAVDATWDAGIVTFKSNGNGGPAFGTMTVPAAARGILAIGSLLDPFGSGGSKHGFVLSSFSSRGPTTDGRVKPDLVAPGESIRAANTNEQGYTVKSGTSMASPFAAGAAALVLAANPDLQPDDVRDLLRATAEDRGAVGPDNDFGHGRIRVWDAVTAALAAAGTPAEAVDTTLAPRQEAVTTTPTDGLLETAFTVTDTAFPVAATVLSDRLVLHVDIVDAQGRSMAQSATAGVSTGTRQHHLTFRPTAPGEYRVRALVAPGAKAVVDLSHSTEGR
jgi:serine protease AprX